MALDKINHEASINTDKEIQYISICLGGRPDDAREIIEQPSIPKWNSMDGHYHMDFDSKEILKELLKFKTVPFYLVFDHFKNLLFSGSKLDIDSIPIRRRCVQSLKVSSSSSFNYSSRIKHDNTMVLTASFTKDVVDQCPVAEPIGSDSESSNTSYDDDLSITTKQTSIRSTSPTRIFEIEDLDF
jgi:hypothetical protein